MHTRRECLDAWFPRKAQSLSLCGSLGVNLVAIHEYLVLKYDGKTAHFPVVDGDGEQAKTRASLCRLPGDCIVAVTEHSYVCVCPEGERRSRALQPLTSPAT